MKRKILKKITALALTTVVSVSLSGCANDNKSDADKTTESTTTASEDMTTEEPTTKEPETEPYLGPEKLNFYVSDWGAGCRKLVTEYTGEWIIGRDILSIDVFATDEAKISSDTFSVVWREYWEKYEQAYNYKIGYMLEFDTVSEGKIKRTILEPDDIYGFLDYIEVYIYDDVNVPPNTWYSHLLQEQMTEKTYITSIKLTCGKRIDEVSNIMLSAFVYDDEKNFDIQGNYVGEHIIKCPVYKK